MSDIRLDEAGFAWQACPNCGLDRIPSASGIQQHDEFCNGPFQRYMTMLADRGLRPFERLPWINPRTERVEPRVLGELLPLRWRVAQDEWHRLEHAAAEMHRWSQVERDLPARLYGWPIRSDSTLSSGRIVLETDED